MKNHNAGLGFDHFCSDTGPFYTPSLVLALLRLVSFPSLFELLRSKMDPIAKIITSEVSQAVKFEISWHRKIGDQQREFRFELVQVCPYIVQT